MIFDLVLDIEKGDGRFSTVDNPITLRQQDAEAYVLAAAIREGGAVMDLTGYDVRFYALRPDGGKVIDGENVVVTSPTEGLVAYTVPKELTAATGDIPTAYFRVTSGGYSASTENVYIKVVPSIAIEATSGDYIPEVDALLAAMEAQRVSYASAEQLREIEWDSLVDAVNTSRGRANSAADRCEAFLETFKVEWSDLSDEAKAMIASAAASGVEWATQEEIDAAFNNTILPAIGGDNAITGLTQADYDYALAKIFG